MHDMIFSTLDDHGLRDEPRVTLNVTTEFRLQISYSNRSICFYKPLKSVIVDSSEAFPIFTRYLRHLWVETVPEPIPKELRGG